MFFKSSALPKTSCVYWQKLPLLYNVLPSHLIWCFGVKIFLNAIFIFWTPSLAEVSLTTASFSCWSCRAKNVREFNISLSDTSTPKIWMFILSPITVYYFWLKPFLLAKIIVFIYLIVLNDHSILISKCFAQRVQIRYIKVNKYNWHSSEKVKQILSKNKEHKIELFLNSNFRRNYEEFVFK